jgi:hypothetical protein
MPRNRISLFRKYAVNDAGSLFRQGGICFFFF